MRRGPHRLRAGLADNGGSASYNIYETADRRFITIAADEEKFWANFCRAVGRNDWIPRRAEAAPQDDLIAQVRALIGSRDLRHWDALLANVDCCYEPVLEPTDVPDHPQVVARALLQRSDIGGPAAEVLYPAWIDGAPPPRRARHVEIDMATAFGAWENRAG